MEYLPSIGFGILILSVELMIIWRNLTNKGIFGYALLAICVGLLAWLLGTFVSEDMLLRNTGYAVVFIGFLSLVQWLVQTGRSKPKSVRCWGFITGSLGILLVLIWFIWWLLPR